MKTKVVDIHKVKCPKCKGKGEFLEGEGSFGKFYKVCRQCKGAKTVRPEFDVYIGRRLPKWMDKERITHKSKWANPFKVFATQLLEREDKPNILELYEDYIRKLIEDNPIKYDLNELKGKRLGCWCVTTDKIQETCTSCGGDGNHESPYDSRVICHTCNGTGKLPMKCHGQVLMKLIEEML